MILSREQFDRLVRRGPYFFQKRIISIIKKREFNAWLKSGKKFPPPRIVKESIIERHKRQSGLTTMVETGTYLGDMVFTHLQNFKKIYSIELDDFLYRTAKKRFKAFNHVEILQGDSGKILAQITNRLNEPAIFWLDGHYSGGFTAMGEKVTPVYEELKIIFSQKVPHIILIDDARLFNGSNGYPALNELKEFIQEYFPGLPIEVSDDCIQFVMRN